MGRSIVPLISWDLFPFTSLNKILLMKLIEWLSDLHKVTYILNSTYVLSNN